MPYDYDALNRYARPQWLRWLPLPVLIAAAMLEHLSPVSVGLTFLVGASPLLAAVACGPVVTAVYGVASVAVAAWLFDHDSDVGGIGLSGHNELLVVVGVALVGVLAAAARARYDRRLNRVGGIAAAVQLAVLPRLQGRVGDIECAALYRSAQRDAIVGGDLFDVRESPYGVRAIIGDVKGHGLDAVSNMAALLGAFHEAVLDVAGLEQVAERLERRLAVDNADRDTEQFATALLIGFPPGGGVELVVCGHIPPYVLSGGGVRRVRAVAAPPLGLGELVPVRPSVLRLDINPGDVLFACTDGALEARDANGRFYPLEWRLAELMTGKAPPLARLTRGVWEDLRRFAPEINDDVALLALRRADGDGDGENGDAVHLVYRGEGNDNEKGR
ncbi:PP2C family protein-serine/threonine phosphatase [Phytomonospora sp. NPDC050363]|uniref:PP2C family protein-serine/threonine phosphatase n=1 Tax=Phytomonospora sp. NPDC050363 TaxID=3155642 RepID=UPI0033D48796